MFPHPADPKKKKPPPRPPPPNFSKYKSKSTFHLNQQFDNLNLMEWTPPSSPKVERHRPFGGSVSSSFSSSTSSLTSSKRSLDNEILVPLAAPPSRIPKASTNKPTIIRAALPTKRQLRTLPQSPQLSLPMPTVPPPSPPKIKVDVETPCGLALYDYPATHAGDLSLQANDLVVLLRRINSEWLYGRVADKEGMFPSNFIDIHVPLPEDEKIVNVCYEFQPQQPGDLHLVPGHKVNVLRKISDDWLYGESQDRTGQFPSNFVDRIPKNL